jgi:quercetin dioxygenase-like cupin family protein
MTQPVPLRFADGHEFTNGVLEREVLPREIAGVRTIFISLQPKATFHHFTPTTQDCVYLVCSGSGTSTLEDEAHQLRSEMLAHFPAGRSLKIEAGDEGLTLLALHLDLASDDLAERAGYDARCRMAYVKHYADGERYAEKIKSAGTVSRTILPAGIVPRLAIGMVEARGPDTVGLHSHPMLEQYFLGLEQNDITVLIDGAKASLQAGELLHIPLGSHHGAEVAAGSQLRYLWIDFFLSRDGQEWLKEHRPVDP